ncbi:MAG: ABC transporter permease [Lachnospiraceae bacterium]|nr:ABC transporter permease [Lachnospiraceae bacterium]
MKNWIQIYTILWKQYLQKHRLWIIFLVAAAFTINVIGKTSALRQEEYRGIAVGICWEDEKGKELLQELDKEEGIFRFLGYTDEDEMIRLVENGTLECGYLFPENFYDHLLEEGAGRQVTLYYSPASSAYKISYEVVFAELFEILSEDILTDYFKESGYNMERLLALNRQYAGDGSTFQFVYEAVEQKGGETVENMDTFKGCMGVMMFLMSLLGLGNAMEQEKTWKALPGRLGRRLKSGSIHVAVLGSILMGGCCLLITDMQSNRGGFGRELMALGIYFMVLELYVRLLGLLIKKSRILYGLLPVLILASCLFCPVFIRMENYINGAAWISRLFPVSYYLDI